MAGHSQFKNIMYRKGAQDKKRAKLFSKLAREIYVAAKLGGPDPESNPRLRTAIVNARKENMPNDNIDRAIKKSEGSDSESYEEVRYEGYGPGGSAIIVQALTDNRNRTASEVRAAFSKHGGNLGETGSVSHMFEQVGEVTYKRDAGDTDEIFEAALEAGAEDVESDKDGHRIYCRADDLNDVRDALESSLGDYESARLIWRPQMTTEIGENQARTLLKLIDVLDDSDDVQSVFSNFDIPEEVMEKLSAE